MAQPIGGYNPGIMIVPNQGEQLISALENRDLMQLEQIFRGGLIGIDPIVLGKALVISIEKGLFDNYGQRIFTARSQAQDIAADGDEWSIGHAVLMAIHKRNLPALRFLRQHYQNFDEINEEVNFGIGQALLSEIKHLANLYSREEDGVPIHGEHDLADILNFLLDHPKACEIQEEVPSLHLIEMDTYEGEILGFQLDLINPCLIVMSEGMENIKDQLGILLRHAVIADEDEDLEVVRAVLNPEIAHLIHPNGRFGLGRALVHAAYYSDFEAVQAILEHQKAREIRSARTAVPTKTKLESDRTDLCSYGLQEAIYFALQDVEDDVQAQKIAQLLLDFAIRQQIPLNSGFFSLKTIHEWAIQKNYLSIAQTLGEILDDDEDE